MASNSSTHETSGTEYMRRVFFETLTRFYHSRGVLIDLPVVRKGKEVDLYVLYHVVCHEGGIERIIAEHKWIKIKEAMGFTGANNLSAFDLYRVYGKFLYLYELDQYWKGQRMPNSKLASFAGVHPSAISSMIAAQQMESINNDLEGQEKYRFSPQQQYSLDSTEFPSESSSFRLLMNREVMPAFFNFLETDREYRDGVLITEDGSMTAELHRVVVAYHSPFLVELMAENDSRRCNLSGVDSYILGEFVRFFYSGSILVAPGYVDRLEKQAWNYQVSGVFELCRQYKASLRSRSAVLHQEGSKK